MDLSFLMKGKQAWETFQTNHPQFPKFLDYVKKKGLPVGTEINVVVTYPDGQNVKNSLKIKPEDLPLIDMIQNFKM